jgi:hypothetical protein
MTVADLAHTYPGIGRSIQSFQAGTCLSNRLRGEANSFRLFEWSPPRLRSDLFLWTGRGFAHADTRHFMRTADGLEEKIGAA